LILLYLHVAFPALC